jgi:hypothetical protein
MTLSTCFAHPGNCRSHSPAFVSADGRCFTPVMRRTIREHSKRRAGCCCIATELFSVSS